MYTQITSYFLNIRWTGNVQFNIVYVHAICVSIFCSNIMCENYIIILDSAAIPLLNF